MEKNKKEIESGLYEIAEHVDASKKHYIEEKKRIKKQDKIASFGTCISLVATILALYSVPKIISNDTQYLTNKEVYSVEHVVQTNNEPEYLKKINGYEAQLVMEYGPWIQEDEVKYSREVHSYNVTNSGINKDNYLSSNLEDFNEKMQIQTKYNPLYLDEYDGYVREFVILTQDPEVYKQYTDIVDMFIAATGTAFASVVALLGLALIYKGKYNESVFMTNRINRKVKHNKTLSKSDSIALENKKKLSSQLWKEYISYKYQFINEYSKYRDIINNPELEKKYHLLLKK